jgi:peptidyl-Lys metalloendopeptidase
MDGKRKLAAVLLLGMGIGAGVQAAPAAPASGVQVTVTPQRSTLGRTDDVMVTVTMTNTSNAPQYLLAWQTPFGRAVEAPLFEVRRDGLAVPYLGIQAKRPAPAPSDYVVLAPGASRSASVELSALYDMRVTGAYSVRWRSGAAQLFSRPGVPRPRARAEAGGPASMWIEGAPRGAPPAAAAPANAPAGLGYSNCSNAQQGVIAEAVQAGHAMAADAEAYLHRKTLGARYTTWFGALDAARSTRVGNNFVAIRDAFATRPVTVDCGCNEPYYAYVYPNQPYKIHVCRAFWNAPMTGTDSKGGTLVHEMSHFTVVADTDDWAYGQPAAAALAVEDPARAIGNADSHEYFGENEPRQDLR